MSQEITKSLKSPIDNAFGLVSQFIEVCPEDIWKETSGGWPVWQQIYHSLGAVDFFLGTDGGPGLVPGPVAGLQEIGTEPLTKDQVRGVLAEAQAKVEKIAAGLADADLPKRNEPLFAKFNYDLSLAATLVGLASHTLYHLGSCDAALRNHGRPGVF